MRRHTVALHREVGRLAFAEVAQHLSVMRGGMSAGFGDDRRHYGHTVQYLAQGSDGFPCGLLQQAIAGMGSAVLSAVDFTL